MDKRTIYQINIDIEDFNYSQINLNLFHKYYYLNIIWLKGIKIKKSFEISLFDTAGQERFRSMTKSYLRGAQGIILIYDINDRISFEHVEMWLSNIKETLSDWETSNNYLIMLLGNKLDLLENNVKERAVNIEEVEEKYGNSGIFIGGECSVKEFTDSQILDIIKNFTIKVYNKIGETKINIQQPKKIKSYKKKRNKCF